MTFIPEITTTVRVTANTDELEQSLSIINNDSILSECFGDVFEYLQEKKKETEKLVDPTALAVSESLSAYQSAIIKMKHYKTGMMANSVDVMHDGDGVYLVGNTAMSVDGFPYPLAIEKGRREVTPVDAKVLRWFEGGLGGTPVFSKRSRAVKADPFVQPSIDDTMDDIDEVLSDFIERLI